MRDGWLMTGDVGHFDADGYLHLAERKKDLILKSGFHVYPREVEAVLLQHPKVHQAAVVGVGDRRRGEEVKAFVVLKDGENGTVDELKAYCGDKLAAYKCPSLVSFVPDLPRGGTGKVIKRELRKLG